ncbi:MAG: GAF domain-containing protein [Acidimicrobiia bacterium]|nr:GAF domain-containing protein [Acidimicrobiia bacterium]
MAAPIDAVGSDSPVAGEARLVGIRGTATPTLEVVDRRRSQLWTLVFAGLVCLSVSVAILATGKGRDLGIANTVQFRAGTVLLVVALAFYVVEKERHLRRLAHLLVDERVKATAASERLKELESLHAAGTAMNSVLVIEEVLRVILSSAFELLQPVSGSIMLLQGPDTMVVVCKIGRSLDLPDRTRVGEGLEGRVALQRVPTLVRGTAADGRSLPTECAICAPLVHRGELLGTITLSGSAERVYSDYDLQSVSLFAGHAAVAIANSRLNASELELHRRLEAALSR